MTKKMGMGDTLGKEVKSWGMLAILIVIISLVLIKFKLANPGNITCASGTTFNATLNKCCANGFACNAGNQTAIGTVGGTLDTFVTALSEPKNWVIIAIIALIGFAILKYFQKKKGN